MLTGAFLSGCESGSAVRNVAVTYTFENVRTEPGNDEWRAIREILARRAAGEPKFTTSDTRTLGAMKVANYRATVTVPQLKTLDAIQSDLEALAEGDERTRSRFTLVSLSVGYRSNVVAATASTLVSGFATAGYRVKLYAVPGEPPQVLTAGRNGMWTTRVDSAPVGGWIYGVAEDPQGRDQPAFFRVNVLTRVQERVDAATFQKVHGSPDRSATNASPAAARAAETPTDDESRAIEARRRAEDEARRRRIEQEDAARRNRKF